MRDTHRECTDHIRRLSIETKFELKHLLNSNVRRDTVSGRAETVVTAPTSTALERVRFGQLGHL